MSRSYKKVNVIKDASNGMKEKGNRRLRRKTKSKLQSKPLDEDLILPEDKSEVMNDYDVCDWKFGDGIGSFSCGIKGIKVKKVNK